MSRLGHGELPGGLDTTEGRLCAVFRTRKAQGGQGEGERKDEGFSQHFGSRGAFTGEKEKTLKFTQLFLASIYRALLCAEQSLLQSPQFHPPPRGGNCD